jgi:hypothetical protein
MSRLKKKPDAATSTRRPSGIRDAGFGMSISQCVFIKEKAAIAACFSLENPGAVIGTGTGR